MDLFIERIVARKKDYVDYLIILATIIISFIIAFLIILMTGPVLFGVGVGLVTIIGYIGYRIITSRNIEYEYSLTNGDLEISKIIAKKRRKRIFYGSCRQFEVVDKASSERHKRFVNDEMNKIHAVSSMKSQDVYFFISNYNDRKTIVYFEPCEKIIDKIRSLNRKAFL
ncbi:DUF6106 family protein [Acetivibrio clariflavus]|uniref:Uncharacterized protein n=1 Tax=Acetivibrio clariflavus (strain DSM 19732 / NBRC 101661 / EBR45) TaxID=720554 RepID=G8M0K1_ACECE|nr:DUF6106 family protein [Acetivibrio clariflavus]AEV69082.1 hypothetical protein Clocl_2512 [Acetivibrio clariflavus DSM 19732]